MMREFALACWDFALWPDANGACGLRTADLVTALVADADPVVRTSAPVTAIEQHDSTVSVTTRDGTRFAGSAAVVAVPLNALGAVSFVPALGAGKQAVIKEGQASLGRVSRVHAAALATTPASAR